MIYLDALVVKVRDGAHVRNKAAHIAIGVDLEGIKHVLGIWVVLIVCCDGLTGFAEAIKATWTRATVQTCVAHLIRAAMRFVNYKDRKAVAAALKPIYQARDADAARVAFEEFIASPLGQKYPNTVATFQAAWERFIPFLAFPPELRKVIYTTNAIESLDYQLRKDHKEPWALPGRRRRHQAALARDLQHRGQASPRTRTRQTRPRTQGRRPPRRSPDHHELEASPRPTRTGLPQPNPALPMRAADPRGRCRT